jgi:hypothetical protein
LFLAGWPTAPLKAPNPKHQAPEKHQTTSSKRCAMDLMFEYCCFFGAWILVLDVSGVLDPTLGAHGIRVFSCGFHFPIVKRAGLRY